MDSLDDFLRGTSGIPGSIGDAPAPPSAVPGQPPPADPMKPWRSIEVGPYVPVAKWAIRQAYSFAAKRFNEPLWLIEESELDSLPLTEAVQKCLYDLRLARWADNPYIALLAALMGLTGAKYAAIKIVRMMEELERRERELAEREARASGRQSAAPRQQNAPAATSQPTTQQGARVQQQQPPRPSQAAASSSIMVRPNQPRTNAGLSMANGRMPESEGASLSVDSLIAASPSSFVNVSEPDDE